MSAPISRKQAWCKLAVLIADGLPAPSEIRFVGQILCVTVGSETAAQAWATPLGTRPPWEATTTRFGTWEGNDVQVYVYPQPEPEPVAEGMSRVREVAEHGRPLTDEAMDGALLYLADQLNRHPEVLDDERSGAVTE